MPVYKYMVVNEAGEKIKSVIHANNENEVLSILRKYNYYPIEIKEIKKKSKIKDLLYINKVKTKDIAIFCRQFYTLLNSGITILTCLDILKSQTENKNLKSSLNQCYEDVQRGMSFSESLKKNNDVFPSLLISMIEVGEVSGNLDIIMNRMATYYEKENKIYTKVKGAMTYPIILSIVSAVVVTFLLAFILPTFVVMFENSGVSLPMPTRLLLNISHIIIEFGYLILIILISILYILKKVMQNRKISYTLDKLKLKIPIVKDIVIKVITSRFSRSLAILVSSGVPLIRSLEIVSSVVGNKFVSDKIQKSKDDVLKGVSLAVPIEKVGIFPPMLVHMIKVGEESGMLDDMLDKTSDFYDDEVDSAFQKMTTLIEPLMIVVMSIIVGFIVLAIILPMFDMINTVSY
ncbi:type IV pilus assembly protein PilC [Alkalithermobacter thermoalcaliphilus JW-YL-7 = DSM 7308]|uniref:Type II secretion system F domain-containing protein n=1 Tax=Alkalithermobacter thermoalcaliphilus JW-YL-7 = DSM 7308 TaxID=1121328 RepID=A0A150FT81_CLOPD|nr:Type II secretion system F domain-containing protein [[Clostridium] paradoxum JW-YL-7 = DSM 7308]SHL37011.1 type IV pilus assembly protein PilC [[Clostridium] paradoxum JW-YL-7 = DSM 7308]